MAITVPPTPRRVTVLKEDPRSGHCPAPAREKVSVPAGRIPRTFPEDPDVGKLQFSGHFLQGAALLFHAVKEGHFEIWTADGPDKAGRPPPEPTSRIRPLSGRRETVKRQSRMWSFQSISGSLAPSGEFSRHRRRGGSVPFQDFAPGGEKLFFHVVHRRVPFVPEFIRATLYPFLPGCALSRT